MAKVKKLSVILTARNRMKKGFRSANMAMRKWAKKAGMLASRAGLLIGGAIAAGIGLSIRSFLKLDEAMTKSLAITKGVSREIRSEMLRTAQVISKDALFSASELAEGYFFLTSAGKSLAQSQILLKDVTAFAQAGQFDLTTATTLLADAQKTLGLSSQNVAQDQKNLVRVSDVLVKANTLANANTQQFSEALTNQAGPAMRAFNIDLEEGVAVLAAYADQGIKGAEAGTMLGRALRLLIPAAKDNEEAYRKLGVNVFNASGDLNNMADIARDLTNAFDGMSAKERAAALDSLGFAKRMQAAIFPLLGAGDAIAKYEKELRKAGGTTKDIAANQLNSVNAQFKLLTNNLNAVVAELFGFEKGADSLMETLKNINTFFREDATQWINTIKVLAIEAKFGFKTVWTISKSFFHNISLRAFEIIDNVGVVIDRFINKLKDLFEVVKDPTNVSAWKKALSPDLEPPKFDKFKDGYIDIADEVTKLMKDKTEAINEFVAKKIFETAGKPIGKFGGGGVGGGGLKPLKIDTEGPQLHPKFKVETSVVGAVQKGTSEALKLENQRANREDKIEKNTKDTASGIKKLVNVMEWIGTGIPQPPPTVDVFAGSAGV